MDQTEFFQVCEALGKSIAIDQPANERASVSECLIETSGDVDYLCEEIIVAQWLMRHLNPDAGPRDKHLFLRMAEHMGPDYGQALYHAAVFMTKVA